MTKISIGAPTISRRGLLAQAGTAAAEMPGDVAPARARAEGVEAIDFDRFGLHLMTPSGSTMADR